MCMMIGQKYFDVNFQINTHTSVSLAQHMVRAYHMFSTCQAGRYTRKQIIEVGRYILGIF